jgi:hypothetical protein
MNIRLNIGEFRVFGGYRYQLLLRIAILHLNEVSIKHDAGI